MKPIAWIAAFSVAASGTLLIVNEPNSISEISYSEARRRVDGLDGRDGMDLISTQTWKGRAVLGSTIEKQLRDLLHVKQRDTPFRIESHQFRDSAGSFSIKICDKEGESAEVNIYLDTGISKPSDKTRDRLLALFPNAHLEPEPGER